MKQLLITIAAVVLVGCGESQQSAPTPELKPIARVAGAKAPDISIHEAVKEGNVEAVKQHIAAGTDVNAKDFGFSQTGLHFAVKKGHKEIVELLIASGADVNAKDGTEWPALHHAAGQGHKGIAELLIVEGADLNAKDKWECTPLHNAASEGQKVIVELLIAKGADVNVKSNVRGVNTNKTPLDWAIEENHTETTDLLRKHGGKTGEELKAKGK